ncbi:MAG: NADP-dependent phosphogluconate dehydrogenase [Bdellovibrionales bacterium]|nr:NADP-dependent phosphogluconate dehydrogenase [Bdellovibrionales bacterium]
MTQTHVALIGLAVMGSNLARNIARHGYPVVVYNRTTSVTKAFMQDFGSSESEGDFLPVESLEQLVATTAAPRQIILMIQAGKAVDLVLDQLLPLLDRGDILIDAGNAYFEDTIRRESYCSELGISFLGIGVSGGEEGALHGPSIMPGGDRKAWEVVDPMLRKISAQVHGEPCTSYVGPNGAGHFVKMVHNGIEYGDMQLIAEVYHLFTQVLGYSPEDLARIFQEWNKGPLRSFLIEITSEIFREKDVSTGGFVVDAILDKAGQKGTGRWTVMEALKLGVSIPTIAAAVDARVLSSQRDERVRASNLLGSLDNTTESLSSEKIEGALHDALFSAKVLSYAQGMYLMQRASLEYGWDLHLGEIASLWRGGCIIRADFLDSIRKAYDANPQLENLVLDPSLREQVLQSIDGLRTVVSLGADRGVPLPAMSASLAYFDSLRSARLPQNLTQAQRDFFGAHTYERLDRSGVFHTHWGKGEEVKVTH